MCSGFTEVAVSNAGLEGRQEVIPFPFLLEKEAGEAHEWQVQIRTKRIWR